VRELPIIFNTEMVRAILDGRKTVTRRPVKDSSSYTKVSPCSNWNDGFIFIKEGKIKGSGTGKQLRCPYGQICDHLYVRETWRVGAWDEDNGEIAFDYKADGHIGKYVELEDDELFSRLWEQSCEDAEKEGCEVDENERYSWCKGESPCRWRPSIHMPKAAARIWLEIADIRVERVQDITEEQAEDEGFAMPWETPLNQWISSRDRFAATWNSIYGNWVKSPLVWVIEFKRIENHENHHR